MDTSRLVSLQALTALQNNHALLFDLREPDAFQLFHLNCFINLPFSKRAAWQPKLPKNQPFYFICEYGKTAYELAITLHTLGYDAYSFSEGIEHIKKVPLKNDTYW